MCSTRPSGELLQMESQYLKMSFGILYTTWNCLETSVRLKSLRNYRIHIFENMYFSIMNQLKVRGVASCSSLFSCWNCLALKVWIISLCHVTVVQWAPKTLLQKIKLALSWSPSMGESHIWKLVSQTSTIFRFGTISTWSI